MNSKGKSLNIKESKESWSEYTIDDGTVIKLKPIVTKITLINKKEKKIQFANTSRHNRGE